MTEHFSYWRKFYFSKIVYALYFLIINAAIFLLRLNSSGKVILEFYFLLQILFINFVLVYFLQRSKILTIISLIIVNLSYIAACSFYFMSGNRADYHYMARNAGHLFFILWERRDILLILFLMALAYAWLSYRLMPRLQFTWQKTVGFSLLFLLLIFQAPKYNNELVYFVKNIFHHDVVIDAYQEDYQKILASSAEQKKSLKIDKINSDSRLENIIILHLESLNAFEINDKHTPNLLKIAEQGTYFENFYSNSVQTLGAYENIFCSLPSSFDKNLVQTPWAPQVTCLPYVMKQVGYQTIIFKGGARLNETGTDVFENDIGFSEGHNSDIMAGFTPLPWGYRENEFYDQVFKYLGQDKNPGKRFIYIDIGTTNHYPFVVRPEFAHLVPYPRPQSVYERLANTTFLQDRYLAYAWQKINELYPRHNFTLLILSDNSWPVGLQSKNTFNESGAYEENFRIPLIVINGNDKNKGKIIKSRYSQMDVMPGVLDMVGVDYTGHAFAKSFVPEMNGEKADKTRNILLIQPYSQKFINVIDEQGIKYQYNSEDGSYSKFDLNTDPLEKNPTLISSDRQQIKSMLDQLLN